MKVKRDTVKFELLRIFRFSVNGSPCSVCHSQIIGDTCLTSALLCYNATGTTPDTDTILRVKPVTFHVFALHSNAIENITHMNRDELYLDESGPFDKIDYSFNSGHIDYSTIPKKRYWKEGFVGSCYFWRSKFAALWSAVPWSTNRFDVLPLADQYKIAILYFTFDFAKIDEAITYVYRVDQQGLPYRWLEARSHYLFVWLDDPSQARVWLERAPRRLDGTRPYIEWASSSRFGRRLVLLSDCQELY